ncbi:ectonucleoside triphosphate diphosphohydrolase 8 isoform X1 [Sturnira hondurensis]|uniref:ectonucleoside triphosphate diphosphohydrolase 8 isoform X1 n=1 Tax=Sturnira hondurensis TaxID=192404 RepID=UPI00187A3D61|nr:ectonucleoside triphosphate diphosphohydrolase 8 isoform X1 [Sturnira hondurensis]XP_036892656.1 ectonucleoside triphosphate diphosphohydrolase 8 isoform X1 [Sturnira hondurensis]XP_036892657.1 ectonucleoside triphosphate diphosphohydrolase 8 isoform X1 [Sturnira hondurensis]
MRLTCKEWVLTALLGGTAASALTTLILILVEATNVLLPADTKFGVVLDAGSSHTSLVVYRWPADKENDTGVVSQALACRVKGQWASLSKTLSAQPAFWACSLVPGCCVSGPGISSYASDPAQAGESLEGCLQEALAVIPAAQHQQTPMFLGATAGMRLLSQKNSSQAADIFAAVARALGQAPLDFWGAELLPGQDEGAFGWITVNYILGLLVKCTLPGEWIRPPEGTLVGALDMGGASTQITFVPGGPIQDKSSQATFRLYGFEHSIYTHSYLCFGRDAMLSRLLAQLVQSRPSRLVRHPCYHSGYQDTLSLAHLLESPCVQATALPHLPQNLTVEGTGNPRACVSAIRDLFDFSSCEGRGDCAFSGVYQPPVRGQFYAFSSFYYTFHFLNLTSGQTLATANSTVWEFCQKTWRQVEAASAGRDSRLHEYCASGLYILTLLVDGYGFSEHTWPSIEFRKQAGGTDIGWTLGYMLNLTNMIPAEAPAQWRAQSYGVWVASVTFVVLTLGAILAAAAALLLWPWD